MSEYYDGDKINCVCGCINKIDEETGILRRVSNCEGHPWKDPKSLGISHYQEIGVFDVNWVPQSSRYIEQLEDALDSVGFKLPFWPNEDSNWFDQPVALEIGCGCSMYAGWLLRMGYDYAAVEPNRIAADWTANISGTPTKRYDAKYRNTSEMIVANFEDADLWDGYSLVLAAHVFEHMDEAPQMLKETAGLLVKGGRLIMIVPDDSDPMNPDHKWFFTKDTLKKALERSGFDDIRIASRRVIVRENFLYCTAVKS